MVFLGVKIFVFASQRRRIFFATLYFFYKKQYFLRHKVLTEYFFLPISETEFFFQSILPTEIFFPKKTIALQVKWMFTYFKFWYISWIILIPSSSTNIMYILTWNWKTLYHWLFYTFCLLLYVTKWEWSQKAVRKTLLLSLRIINFISIVINIFTEIDIHNIQQLCICTIVYMYR